MTEQTSKKKYEAPALTVVTIKSERGYVGSGDLLKSLWIGYWISDSDPSNVYGIENYNEKNLTW